MSVPQLRPLGVGEMLDVALKIFWRNAWTMFRLVFLIVAPVTLLTTLLTVSALPDEDELFVEDPAADPFATDASGESAAAFVAGIGLAVLLGFIASTLATAACFKAVTDAYLGERPSWRTSLRFVTRRFHSVLWITILGSVLTAIGFLFCLIPGIYLWAAFAVAIPVLLTESEKGRHALGRSRDLVQDNWWRTFGVVVLGTVLTGVVGGGIGGLIGAVTAFEDPDGDSPATFTATFIADLVAQTLTVPFMAALVTVLYVDLRVRKEAFDLQLLAQQIGVEPRPESAPAVQAAREGLWPPEADAHAEEQPPFWPPPPGWKPGGGSSSDQ